MAVFTMRPPSGHQLYAAAAAGVRRSIASCTRRSRSIRYSPDAAIVRRIARISSVPAFLLLALLPQSLVCPLAPQSWFTSQNEKALCLHGFLPRAGTGLALVRPACVAI